MQHAKSEKNANNDEKSAPDKVQARAALEAWIKNFNAWCHDQPNTGWVNDQK